MHRHGVAGGAVLVHPPPGPAGADLYIDRVVKMSAPVSSQIPRAGGCWRRLSAYPTPSPVLAGLSPPGPRGREGAGVLRARVTDPSLSVVQRGFPVRQGWDVGGAGCSDLDPGQVDGQVVGGPAVAGDEGRGLRELVESRRGQLRNWASGLPCWRSRRGGGRRNWPARCAGSQRQGEARYVRCPPPDRPCVRLFRCP